MAANKIDIAKNKLLQALEQTLGVVTTACKTANISRETHYRWIKEDEAYRESVQAIEGVALDFAESKLHKAINQENITAIIFYLKTKGKARGYIERQDYGIDVEQPIKINIGKRD